MSDSPINLENFEILGENIYVYKNFISESEINKVLEEVKNVTHWIIDENFKNTMERCNTKTTGYIREKIQNLLGDGYFASSSEHIVKMTKGNEWPPHSDVHDFELIEYLSEQYREGEDFTSHELSVFGTIVYYKLPESGGGLYYPKQSIEYMPSPGDLVIHGSGSYCEHGVTKIFNGERYSTSGNIYKIVKIKNEK